MRLFCIVRFCSINHKLLYFSIGIEYFSMALFLLYIFITFWDLISENTVEEITKTIRYFINNFFKIARSTFRKQFHKCNWYTNTKPMYAIRCVHTNMTKHIRCITITIVALKWHQNPYILERFNKFTNTKTNRSSELLFYMCSLTWICRMIASKCCNVCFTNITIDIVAVEVEHCWKERWDENVKETVDSDLDARALLYFCFNRAVILNKYIRSFQWNDIIFERNNFLLRIFFSNKRI